MSAKVVVIDIGTGNVGSIRNMLAKIGAAAETTADPEAVFRSDLLILPGVGAFDQAMASLDRTGLSEAIRRRAEVRDAPLLGVCLGMQLLVDRSEEGARAGLGLIPGQCLRFPPTVGGSQLRVPHMGWNTVRPTRTSEVLPSLGLDARYYFIHSYYVAATRASAVLGTTEYGIGFASAIEQGSIVGVQFHPEKSHRHGIRLLGEFIASGPGF